MCLNSSVPFYKKQLYIVMFEIKWFCINYASSVVNIFYSRRGNPDYLQVSHFIKNRCKIQCLILKNLMNGTLKPDVFKLEN